MKLGVVGCGNVGFNTLKAFMTKGYEVLGYDTSSVALEKIVKELGPDIATSDFGQLADCTAIFCCVPTEPKEGSRECDLSIVKDVLDRVLLLESIKNYSCKLFVQRSTCPPGTAQAFSVMLRKTAYAVNPSFLRKKTQWDDTINPERIAAGGSQESLQILADIYSKFPSSPRFFSESMEAVELLKYCENVTDAVLISLWNEFLDVSDMLRIPREHFLSMCSAFVERGKFATAFRLPGQAFGLWCLPKDLAAMVHGCEQVGIVCNVMNGALLTNLSIKAKFGVNEQAGSDLFSLEGQRIAITPTGRNYLLDVRKNPPR